MSPVTARRREFLLAGAAALLTPVALRDALAAPVRAGASPYGPLQAPDANGLMLPAGFTSRRIARGFTPVEGTMYVWPVFPDGQATFRTGDGGWVLVTNSESVAASGAGASAVRFGPDGAIRDAYRILGDTNVNCAGGPTPWGTWLSGEETDRGLIWECDPAGVLPAQARPALGAFKHEAAAVDPLGGRVYLTEDEPDGLLYRFTPTDFPSLDDGLLEAAVVDASGRVTWRAVPEPGPSGDATPTRAQVPGAARFNGGEGIWYAAGSVFFTTKGDRRLWALETAKDRLTLVYDRATAPTASLDAVDNVTVSRAGEILVCEDGGNMEIGIVDGQQVAPLLRFTGPDHAVSEVCGVVFSPAGDRLYCTSQGAFPVVPGQRGPGAVYEITGPFRPALASGSPALVYGPPAGEARPTGPLNPGPDRVAPRLRVRTRGRLSRRALLGRGPTVSLRVPEAATVALEVVTHDLVRVPGRGGSTDRTRPVTLARAEAAFDRAGTRRVRLKLSRRARRRLRGRRLSSVRVLVVARDAAGNRTRVARVVRIRR